MLKQFNLFDDDGKLVKSFTKYNEGLRGDWVVVYKIALLRLIREVPNLATMKVYMHLMYSQSYDVYVYDTVAGISRQLDMSYKTVWKAIEWLIDNGYLAKFKFDGNTAFLLNPELTTCGKASLLEKKEIWVEGQQKSSELELPF